MLGCQRPIVESVSINRPIEITTLCLLLVFGCFLSGCFSDNSSQSLSTLTENQKVQLATATKAKNELGASLMSELMGSFMKNGASGSINVCKTKAPEVASIISEKYGLKIGRTSFKIRNSSNQPPTWSRSFVDQKTPHDTYVALEKDTLGVLFPIRVNSFCLNCHGEKDKLGVGVAESLAKHYPKDQATGFKEKDLRGYFWVEVPAKKDSPK